jgi:hypothetical protein
VDATKTASAPQSWFHCGELDLCNRGIKKIVDDTVPRPSANA